MARKKFDSPDLFLNRELSWLEFNDRVLREGMSEDVPLLERLKFLAIVSSNLDEFFMIRVASLKQKVSGRVRRPDFSGMTPAQQLEAIAARARTMAVEQSQAIRAAAVKLREHDLHLLEMSEFTPEQRQFLARRFQSEILPSLTPLAVEELEPSPILPGLALNLALFLEAQEPNEEGESERRFAVVPVPSALPRFIALPAEKGLHLARLEDAMLANIAALFPGYTVLAAEVFRLTRDADVVVDDEEARDLLQAMEHAVHERGRRPVVRLEIPTGADRRVARWLRDWCGVKPRDVFEIDGMLDARALMEVAKRPGFENLKDADWHPQHPRDLAEQGDLWQALQDRDVMLFHPYETFEPVVRLVELAADDAGVLAIKMTLYRTSGDSPIIGALARAAESGKQVTVLVELKARFEEAKNVRWARRLEDAGCYVIYGIAGFKTHAKVLLVIRREARRVRRYLHLATGNYNDTTAKLYSDIGLMTTDADLAADAAAFCNLLTGYSQTVGWNQFTIAPTGLRQRFLDMIEREIQASTPDSPGLIMAKTNSLHDKEIAQALYRASCSGVRILLNIRGICCLRPGIKKVSENIEAMSIIDRYLEHARIYYFRNGGHEEVYLSSADWMTRNLDKRLEILWPVTQKDLQSRLIGILNTWFSDNVKARRLLPDGTYEPVKRPGPKVRAQEKFYGEALDAAGSDKPILEFRPLARPAE